MDKQEFKSTLSRLLFENLKRNKIRKNKFLQDINVTFKNVQDWSTKKTSPNAYALYKIEKAYKFDLLRQTIKELEKNQKNS